MINSGPQLKQDEERLRSSYQISTSSNTMVRTHGRRVAAKHVTEYQFSIIQTNILTKKHILAAWSTDYRFWKLTSPFMSSSAISNNVNWQRQRQLRPPTGAITTIPATYDDR
ncbi:hypothetical protein M9H77_12513 [Catharanthus roseus]|uniref:Uncharacterized protein n=1 Tax=Catharanthus roseus TaxID=4058 RepID=A0ACC0BHM9_CATRO|nr:hypothetical protein M9H77_12513 [Catharanthus roseus]